MTFSEFGRTSWSNDGRGTDHGTAAPHLVFGARVKGGMYGQRPALQGLQRWDRMAHHVDFRDYYGSVIDGWMGGGGSDVVGKPVSDLGLFLSPDVPITPLVPAVVTATGRRFPAVHRACPGSDGSSRSIRERVFDTRVGVGGRLGADRVRRDRQRPDHRPWWCARRCPVRRAERHVGERDREHVLLRVPGRVWPCPTRRASTRSPAGRSRTWCSSGSAPAARSASSTSSARPTASSTCWGTSIRATVVASNHSCQSDCSTRVSASARRPAASAPAASIELQVTGRGGVPAAGVRCGRAQPDRRHAEQRRIPDELADRAAAAVHLQRQLRAGSGHPEPRAVQGRRRRQGEHLRQRRRRRPDRRRRRVLHRRRRPRTARSPPSGCSTPARASVPRSGRSDAGGEVVVQVVGPRRRAGLGARRSCST